MIITIAIVIYVIGVWVALYQIEKWCGHKITEDDEHQIYFMLSMLSWFIYPLYVMLWLIYKAEEE